MINYNTHPTIVALANQWQGQGRFQDFVSQWHLDPQCALSQWCFAQGDIDMAEGRQRFTQVIKTNPQWARASHYHIGFLVSAKIRTVWCRAAARNSCEAAAMLITDVTISSSDRAWLMASAADPLTGCPRGYARAQAFDHSPAQLVNSASPIVQRIVSRGY
jgi:hypothetical protein